MNTNEMTLNPMLMDGSILDRLAAIENRKLILLGAVIMGGCAWWLIPEGILVGAALVYLGGKSKKTRFPSSSIRYRTRLPEGSRVNLLCLYAMPGLASCGNRNPTLPVSAGCGGRCRCCRR